MTPPPNKRVVTYSSRTDSRVANASLWRTQRRNNQLEWGAEDDLKVAFTRFNHEYIVYPTFIFNPKTKGHHQYPKEIAFMLALRYGKYLVADSYKEAIYLTEHYPEYERRVAWQR